MPTYQLSAAIYLENENYRKIIVINEKPQGDLQTLVKNLPNIKNSPFQSNIPCNPCILGILNPNNTSELLCFTEIAYLFSFLSTHGYTVQYELTKILLESQISIISFVIFPSKIDLKIY